MGKGRLEAFTDGVFAILITILVLELRLPEHAGAEFESLRPLLPVFLAYLMSFVYLGIYWNNHHHMLHAATKVNGTVLWANLHLLFWLSLLPFLTAWMGEHWRAPLPVALYGADFLASAVAYRMLQSCLIKTNGRESMLAAATGTDLKGKLSMALYVSGITLAFVRPWLAQAIYVVVALVWVVPDRRIESRYVTHSAAQ